MIFKRNPILGYLKMISTENPDEIINQWELVDGENIIGKDKAECDIIINFKNISNTHLKIFIQNNEITLEDLNSDKGNIIKIKGVFL